VHRGSGLGYNAKYNTPGINDCAEKWGTTAAKIGRNDWCSGVYAHFDLQIGSGTSAYKKLCPTGDNCVVKKERIPCKSPR